MIEEVINVRAINILLVEDNPGDIRLTREALNEAKINNLLNVVEDGQEALDYLFKQGEYKDAKKPDLILLDLNLPKVNGIDILKKIKQDDHLKVIPVVVLTTSKSEEDIVKSYENYANSYITKPVDMEQFFEVVRKLEDFWFTVVVLPPGRG